MTARQAEGVDMRTAKRVCRVCNKEKLLRDFPKHTSSQYGRRHTCKPCQAKKQRDKNNWRRTVLTNVVAKSKLKEVPYVTALRMMRADPRLILMVANSNPERFKAISSGLKHDILEEEKRRLAISDKEDDKHRLIALVAVMQAEMKRYREDIEEFIIQIAFHGSVAFRSRVYNKKVPNLEVGNDTGDSNEDGNEEEAQRAS